MPKILVAGSGKIGRAIACLLAACQDYEVFLADIEFSSVEIKHLLKTKLKIKTLALDIKDEQETQSYLLKNKISAVISSLPYFLNVHVAKAAKAAKVHYFDLTEDIQVRSEIQKLASNASSAFVTQCGLAPGFVSIAANSLMQEFDTCFQAKLRVGALPERVSNALHYSLTWSTDGLINEYGNSCFALENSQLISLKPLEGLEKIEIDGCEYEAFNTSGGLGGLADLYLGKIKDLNYKTIRYPGHCEKIRLLMNELKLNEDRETLKKILERAIPKTNQDLVIIYITVEGLIGGELIEKSYLKKIYPQTVHKLDWSAIQISTAAGVCAILDLVLAKPEDYRGFILQETFKLKDVLANRFGIYYV